MAQPSAMNSLVPMEQKPGKQEGEVKKEHEVIVKEEAIECAVCNARSRECVDMYAARTPSGASLHHFLGKYTHADLASPDACSTKHVCQTCFDLIYVLERAEIEYVKLKEEFEAIISKNPMFEVSATGATCPVPAPIALTAVKNEFDAPALEEDSEDEPLARRKSNQPLQTVKKKKKIIAAKVKQKKTIDSNRYIQRWI